MDKQLFTSLAKYPFITSENLFCDSVELKQNKSCAKCSKKDCLTLFSSTENLSEYICSNGYNNIILVFDESKFILNGLIFEDNFVVPKGRKDVRKEWITNREFVNVFWQKLLSIEEHILARISETMEKNFSMFHDFKTSMTIFYNCTQDIINNLPGESFEDKLAKSNSSYKDLYNALDLITSQLGMIDVIVNPKRISFGKKRPTNLYQLFEKIKILFGHLAEKKINIEADAWIKDSLCYDTIQFVPLILIDNALKYSVGDNDVIIKVEQKRESVKVIVKSIGPIVAESNKERIFEKFFRDPSGEETSKEGMGMGLWIAQQVLQAHNSKIEYYNAPFTGNLKRGLNIFSFDLPTINEFQK